MARDPREEYRHISGDGMKPQTFTEWFETVNTPGDRQDYLMCLAAWNARGEQDALIADKYVEPLSINPDVFSELGLRTAKSIAEDIRKL